MKFLIHIGLPKTASTTLQNIYFPHCNSNLLYAGKHSSNIHNEIYQYITNIVYSNEIISDTHRNRLKTIISNHTANFEKILISEEMFTVDTDSNTWQTKIKRITQLLGNYQCHFYVVVREPLVALFSLYVELYNTHALKGVDFEQFLMGNQAKIYAYNYLNDVLSKHSNECLVKYYSYESVFLGGQLSIFLNDICGTQNDIRLAAHLNKKQKLSSGYVTNSVTYKDYLARYDIIQTVKKLLPRKLVGIMSGLLMSGTIGKGKLIEYPNKTIVDDYYSKHEDELNQFELMTNITFKRGFEV